MPTKRQLISDIMLQLFQGDVSDDIALERSQVAFWIQTVLNGIISTEISQKISKQEMIPAIYIRRQECEVPEIEENDCEDECQRIFVEVDDEILTVKNGAGIVLVQTDEGDQIRKATVETLSIFKAMRFAKPSENNLLYYAQGDRIYIEGIKQVDVPFEFITVWYVPKQDILSLEDDDEVLVSDYALPAVISSVVEMGRLQMYGTQADMESDGIQKINPVYHQQIAKPQAPEE